MRHPGDGPTRRPRPSCESWQGARVDGQRGDAPDLTGLQPRYPWNTGRSVRVLLVVVGVQAVLAVARLVDDPGVSDVVLSVVQLLIFAVFLGASFVWTPATALTAEGVRLQNGFPRARVIPWAQVDDVQVQARWQDVSLLLLRDGRSERLTGVPADDARRLADALAARPSR